MNGQEAIIKLLSGEKVRRSIWNVDQYWFLKDNKLCNQDKIIFNMTFNELIIGNDWEIYSDLLNSLEALDVLQNGKTITHKNWTESNYIYMKDNKIFDENNFQTVMSIDDLKEKVWKEIDFDNK